MKVRVLSALVAIIILVPFLYYGNIPFAIIVSILGIQGYKEILDLKKSHKDFPTIVKILGLVGLCYIMIGNYGLNNIGNSINYSKVLLPALLLFIPTVFYSKKTYATSDAFYLLGCIFMIGFFFNSIITIRNMNIYLLIYLLSVGIITDTFAFLIGSLIGKHKMSSLSPKKSWEGAIGGFIGGTCISLIIYHNLVSVINFKIIIMTMILSIAGQIGDLFFSKIKRENDIKDFSNIMPGHGGLLDRIDSLTFIVFAYIVLINIL